MAATTSSSGKNILIVEDEKPLAHALELKLKREGFEPTVCVTGQEGMKEAVTGKYAIILLDIIMPEMDGFGLLQEMVKKKVKTPVLVLSNLGLEEDKQKAKGLGVIDYFVKANTPIASIVKRVKDALG